MTGPWKGLGGTWPSPGAAEDPSGSAALPSCQQVRMSVPWPLRGQTAAGGMSRRGPAPRSSPPGAGGHGGWGSWHPRGRVGVPRGHQGAGQRDCLHFLVHCIEEFI